MRLRPTNQPKTNELQIQFTPSDAAKLRTELQPYRKRSGTVETVIARIESQLLTGSDTVDLALSTWHAAHTIETIDEIDDRYVDASLVVFRTALLQAFVSWASAR